MPKPDPARILRQHLMTDRLLGVDAVPVPEGFSPPSRQAPPAAPSRPSPARPTPATHHATPSQPARATPTRPATRPTPTPAPAVPMFSERYPVQQGLSTQDKTQQLEALKNRFEQDAAVQETRPTGTTLVWSDGKVDADIMFIGEGPGEVEDREGLPFVGPAGELLNKMITAMGLDRQDVYIANVVKYRPPGNRVPTPQEAAISGPYLAQQAAIIAPKAIVALGGTAAKFALQTNTGITRLRGQWSSFTYTDPGIDLMPTFHPAYLLRSYTTDNRKKVWEDLQAVLKKVSE
ncbi:MAG: uracil-DNA glycosylase [Phycisphaerales bacterium JB063]